MLKLLFVILLPTLSFKGYSQIAKDKVNAIGISTPIIWNNSETTFYQLGRPIERRGKGTSYGINLRYSRNIYKQFFATFGVGYFKQSFGINRPFNFNDSTTNLAFYTNHYSYNSLHILGGVGYTLNIARFYSLKGAIFYNLLYSFSQKYTPAYFIEDHSQTNHESIAIGNIINLSIGTLRQISKRITIGVDALFPISTHWNKDYTFWSSGWSESAQQIARNKFSIGTSISCNYHF